MQAMDAINARWLQLALAGYVIEVSPNQTDLINEEKKPDDSASQGDPKKGGWGEKSEFSLPAPKSPGPYQKPGYDLATREWRTTWLLMVPLPRIDAPPGQSIPPFPPWRARLDLRELVLEYKPEIVNLILDAKKPSTTEAQRSQRGGKERRTRSTKRSSSRK